MPPQIEWDFSQVADDQISAVALYEYARTSDSLREPIAKWLGTIHKGKTLTQRLIESHVKKDHAGYNTLCAENHGAGLEAARFNYELAELLFVLPYFPKPFFFYGRSPLVITNPLGKDRPKNKPPFSTVTIDPMLAVTERYYKALHMKPGTKMDLNHFGRSYFTSFKLSIRWEGFTTNDIVDDFRKWLAVEAKKHTELKQRGKPSQVSPHTLAWLAALRISRAGVSYAEAQKHLQSLQCHPKYADKAGWSDAVAKAEKLLSDLEAGKSIVGL